MSPPWGSEALLEALAHWQTSHLVLLLLVFSLIDPVAGSAVSHPLHLPAIVQLGLWGQRGCLQVGRVPMQRLAGAASVTA